METPEVDDIPDIENMKLDLSKEEKLRTIALMLGIRYHVETICKDAEAMRELASRNVHLSPTTAEKVIGVACQFEKYLCGEVKVITYEVETGEDICDLHPPTPKKKARPKRRKKAEKKTARKAAKK